MKDIVFLLWVSMPKFGIDFYLDSIWENKKDLDDHISNCLEDVFKHCVLKIEEKQFYKHF